MPKTKIFCDIADSKTIKEFNKKPIVGKFLLNLLIFIDFSVITIKAPNINSHNLEDIK